MQKTFVMIKPNGVLNGLIGNILNRYEFSGLSVNAIRIQHIAQSEAESFYGEHKGRDFYEPLIEFMTSGPTVLLVLGGENAVKAARSINGATNPANADAGTIRYDFAPNTRMNVVHSSDSSESAEREIAFWFKPDEVIEYKIARHTAM